MMIEGLGQQNYGTLNWGDGLITDPAVIANKKLSDPNLFFQQLLKKPYRRQVIVGVHVYPPSISKVKGASTPAGSGLMLHAVAAFTGDEFHDLSTPSAYLAHAVHEGEQCGQWPVPPPVAVPWLPQQARLLLQWCEAQSGGTRTHCYLRAKFV